MRWILAAIAAALSLSCSLVADEARERPRARDLGVVVGSLDVGKHNAITDVPGVRVGHVTIVRGESIRTGITAILPHGRDLFREKVAAAFVSFNGFGKPFGTVQIDELGEIETPLLLGSTLAVPRIADAIIDYVLAKDESGRIRSVNPVVGETNDGYLSDGRARAIRSEDVRRAIESATNGAVAEGSVGAGTGTRCLGYKGGGGTSSRRVVVGGVNGARYTVGVLVQTNFGGELRILGRPLPPAAAANEAEKGSCAIVVATDAPLDARQLKRVARRTFAGMARAGASFSHGSGDYAFAFAVPSERERNVNTRVLDRNLSSLLLACAEATEEAIYNSILRATTVRGRDGHAAEAIDIARVREVFAEREAE